MDETGMTLADKLAYVAEVREVFGDEAAEDLALRIGLTADAGSMDGFLAASAQGGTGQGANPEDGADRPTP